MKAGAWTAIIIGGVAALASAGVFLSRRAAEPSVSTATPAQTGSAAAVAAAEGVAGVEAAAAGDPEPVRGLRDAIAQPDSLDPATASKYAASPIWVLAPDGMSEVDAAAFAAGFKATPDGYFARVKRADYDVVINGTRSFATAPAAATVVTRASGDYRVEAAEGGLNVSFNSDGADYLIEFMCRESAEAEDGCITQDEAVDFVADLVTVGGAGR